MNEFCVGRYQWVTAGLERPPAAPLFLAVAQGIAGWCLCTDVLAILIMRQLLWHSVVWRCSQFWTVYLSGRVARSGAEGLSIFGNKSPRK